MAIKVLCSCSSDEIFNFVKRNLSPFECEVIKSTTVTLSFYLAQKNYPSLILCEPELKEGTALDLLAELRSDSHFQELPFIFLVAKDKAKIWQERNKVASSEKIGTIFYPLSDAAFLGELMPYLNIRQDNRPQETSE